MTGPAEPPPLRAVHRPPAGVLERLLADVLERSHQGDHTCPSPETYPHQWCWDSCLAALGWAVLDPPRAYRELERLVGGAMPGGLVPQIAYTPGRLSYLPGPEWWGLRGADGREISGLTQPALGGTALALIHARHPDRARARALLEPMARWHRALVADRGPETGDPALVHPWESGRDDAPEWDAPLARAPAPTRLYRRQDTRSVAPEERPTDQAYHAYLGLVEWLATHPDPAERRARAPFRVRDPGFSSILARSAADLADLAERVGEPALAREQAALAARVERALAAGAPRPGAVAPVIDLVAGTATVPRGAGAALQALRAGLAPRERSRLAARMVLGDLSSAGGVRSHPAGAPGFEPLRYWRGPVWAPVTWLAALGLERSDPEAAAVLRARLLGGVRRHGAYEYLAPDGGERLGARTLAWTAALGLWELERLGARRAA